MDLSFGNSSFSYPGAARAGGPSPARWAAGLATACLAVGLLLMVTAGEEGGVGRRRGVLGLGLGVR